MSGNSDWPVIYESPAITIQQVTNAKTLATRPEVSRVIVSEYRGQQYVGEPLLGVRIQLGRPGRPFIFLTKEEWVALCERI